MKSKFAAIYAGLGMGLLLGVIMGLSVSPVVKIVMGILATALGGFLAYDSSKFAKQNAAGAAETTEASVIALAGEAAKAVGAPETAVAAAAPVASVAAEPEVTARISGAEAVLQDLRVGSFAFAVVIGIFLGLIVRTNEPFAPTISERISQWTEAGYSEKYARKLVVFQKLGIDPKSGETKPMGVTQKSATSALFSSKAAQNLASKFDPDRWNNSIEVALSAIRELKAPQLSRLAELIKKHIPEDQRFPFLEELQMIFYDITNDAKSYQAISDDPSSWKGNELRKIAKILESLDSAARTEIVKSMKSLFNALENTNEK